MRRMFLVFPLAAMAAALSGCVSPATVKSPLTVELFDMRARPTTAPVSAALEAPAVAIGTGTMGSSPAAEVSITRAPQGVSEGFAVPALSLPQAPGDSSVVEVAVRSAGQKSAMGGLPRLAVPEAPSGPAQKSLAKSATGAASPQAAPASSAPHPSAATASTPQGASAPAVQTAVKKTPTVAESSRVREIYARQGDELQIGLEGKGFIFLGFPDASTQAPGVSFKGKETRDGKSFFTFKALRFGTYELGFLQQDNSTGRSNRETVRVHVVAEAEFAAAIGSGGAAQESAGLVKAPGVTGDYAHAEKLAGLGAREAALEEFLKGYAEGNGYLNDRIATLYFVGGDLDAAEKYYAKNLLLPGRPSETGVLGMVRVALVRGDARSLLSHLKPFLAIQELSIEGELIQAARLEQRTGGTGVGLELLSEYVKRYPDGRWRDEAAWIAGQLYEADSPMRDIARARDIYRGLLQSYPESPFAARARDRVRYIEEHFFTVR